MSNQRVSVPDRDAEFARVVATHRHALLRYGLRRLDDHAEAEDLVAETFVVVWRHFDDLPPRDEELFWLYGIAGRVLANLLRGRQRSMRLEARLAFEREMDRATPRYSKEDVEALMNAIGELSPDERELIQLTYWEKLSYRDIALILAISENAVGIRINRAKRKLRTLVESFEGAVLDPPHWERGVES